MDLGYAGSFLDDKDGSRPLSSFDPDVHQRLDGRAGRYVNSFFFLPENTT